MPKSVAAARMWRPIVVRISRSASSPRAAAATTTATIVILRTSTPWIVVGWLSGAIEVAISPIVLSRMSTSSAIAWSMKAIAKVATSITAGDAPPQGPEDDPVHDEREGDDDDEAGDDAPDDAPVRRERERVGAGHDELAVREVDEAEDAEDEPDPDRHQCIDGPETDSIGQGLRVDDGEERAGHPAK